MPNKFYTNVTVSGDNILIKEVENGVRKSLKCKYQPTLYMPARAGSNSPWHTLTGEPVDPIKFGDIKETRQFLRDNEGVSNFSVYGNTMFQFSYIAETYPEPEIQFNMDDISIVTVDIETECEYGFPKIDDANERINVITVKDFRKDEYHVFTFMDGEIYNKNNYYKPTASNVTHYSSESEEEMLETFLKICRKLDPDVLTGWNCRFFDVPYTYNRIEKLLGKIAANKLSPWNIVKSEIVETWGNDNNCYNLLGISILDYYQLYRKNVLTPRDNYKLGYIAEVELKQTKVDWHSKYETMKEFYRKDFQLFVEYNIQDVHLPDLLEAKLKLIEMVIKVAYMAKVNYVDVFAQVRTWDAYIFNSLLQENIVIPQKEFREKDVQFEGAAVKEPVPGMYENLVSFDLAGLYPSIIRALNIGTETKKTEKFKIDQRECLNQTELFQEAIKIAKQNNLTLGCNGVMYTKEVISFFSRMVTKLAKDRKECQNTIKVAKKELETCKDPARKVELQNSISKNDVSQKAIKVMANSLYGAFGNEYFRFYDLENAEAVTVTGQMIIKFIQKRVNEYLNNLFKTTNQEYITYSDTDSTVGETIIDVNGEKMKIEDFYDSQPLENLQPTINGNQIKSVTGITTQCSDGNEILNRPIEYVMKHEIEKEMFEITVNGQSVVITEDHSVMVERNGQMISVKPKEIQPEDLLFYKHLSECDSQNEVLVKTTNFQIKSLGKKKIPVYDIEVKDVHNFFGNNILLHNSIYLDLTKLVDSAFKGKTKDTLKVIKFLDSVCKTKIEGLIDKILEEITQDILNGMSAEKSILSMKRETISDRGIFSSKKHYILRVWNSEGDNYFECLDCHNKWSGPSETAPDCNSCKSKNTIRTYYLKVMGFEMVKSSTPKFCRDSMKKSVDILLAGDKNKFAKFIDAIRTEFMKMSPEDISKNTGVNGLTKYADPKELYIKGTPKHVKATLAYNNDVKVKGLQQKYPFISESDKVKLLYLKTPNPIHESAIAFPDKLPVEFGLEKYVDYNAMFDLVFLNPLKKITDPIGWDTEISYNMDNFFK